MSVIPPLPPVCVGYKLSQGPTRWWCVQFDGEYGTKLQMAAAQFCRHHSIALDTLKSRQKKDVRLAQFLAVSREGFTTAARTYRHPFYSLLSLNCLSGFSPICTEELHQFKSTLIRYNLDYRLETQGNMTKSK
ncbi:ARHGEF12 [Cordylochernes scorpioides]|uniref:ARHGEF12 n=1 Tax=Cordylochernes scorpioides TaxID=51811 RepID=A0ABY6KUQ4_9ARAC|nr:ARHGEF12 [Cordylochernes scorpioides]